MAIPNDSPRRQLERRQHIVSIVIDDREIDGWLEYQIDNSLVEPADSFTLRRPFDRKAWDIITLDSRVRVLIDGVPRIDGFIDKRVKQAQSGEMEVSGRCRIGRLVQESAPRMKYNGQDMVTMLKELASPWFDNVVTSNARNRKLMVGKGGRPAVGSEPIVLKGSKKFGRINPGVCRWQVIEQIASAEGLAAWSSADGRELIVGQPNDKQGISYLVQHAADGSTSRSNCIDLEIEESIADSFSVITAMGSGATSPDDYGVNAISRFGIWFDDPTNKTDGTGVRFRYPKRLIVPEQTFNSNKEAQAIAEREAARRDFRSDHITATMPFHSSAGILFAPDTVARVIDEECGLDADYLVYAVSARASRAQGEQTTLTMVPRHTRILV